MKRQHLKTIIILALTVFSGCRQMTADEKPQNPTEQKTIVFSERHSETRQTPEAARQRKPRLPSLLEDEKPLSASSSPLAKVDFKNFTYPLLRGWQDKNSEEVILFNGKREADKERIGLEHIRTQFGDFTGDGIDDALVILRIDTGGSSAPHLVYVYDWKEDKPNLLFHFRTGDRADGGLKKVWAQNGELWLELWSEDRYILGQIETMRVEGDDANLCCPKFYTRSHYAWNGKNFALRGERKSFEVVPVKPQIENQNTASSPNQNSNPNQTPTPSQNAKPNANANQNP